MILTSNPKRSRKNIENIVTWMEAFSIFVMILTLLRDLVLSAARFSFPAKHVPGVHNEIADALSRFRW